MRLFLSFLLFCVLAVSSPTRTYAEEVNDESKEISTAENFIRELKSGDEITKDFVRRVATNPELESKIIEISEWGGESKSHQDIVIRNVATIIEACRQDGWNDFAIAGLLGNLQRECGFRAFSYEKDYATVDGCWSLSEAFFSGVKEYVFSQPEIINRSSGGCGIAGFTGVLHTDFSDYCREKAEQGYNHILVYAPWRSTNARGQRTEEPTYMADIDVQIAYLLRRAELSDGGGWDYPEEKPAIQTVKDFGTYNYTSPGQAGAAWLYYYERPNNMSSEARLRAGYAERWYSEVLNTNADFKDMAGEEYLKNVEALLKG